MTDKVNTHVTSLGSDMVIIPGGLTSQVQPADVSWNKPFKAAYRELYNKWVKILHSCWKYETTRQKAVFGMGEVGMVPS